MNNSFLVIAHRGYSSRCPENTAIAFQQAIEAGADMVELDITMSADGHFVVIHDDTLDRTSNAQGFVAHYRLDELKQLDIGSWYGAEFSQQRIMTVDELLETLAPHIQLNIELKPFFSITSFAMFDAALKKLVSAVVDKGLQQRVIFSSINFFVLEHLRSMDKQIRLGVIYRAPYTEFDPIAVCKQLNAWSLHPLWEQVDQGLVERAHNQGIKVYPFTLNDSQQMAQMKALGIDGAFSDYPEKLRLEMSA